LKFAAENHYVRFKGTVPAGTELPTNVLANGEIAAIEIDLDTEADTETEEFKTTIDLITPLPAFLAKRGMQPHFQTMAIDIVSAIIQRRTSVQAEAVDA
jgi:hypothetical protein